MQFTFVSPSKNSTDYRLTDLTLTVQEGSLASELSQNDQQIVRFCTIKMLKWTANNPVQFLSVYCKHSKLAGKKHIKAALQYRKHTNSDTFTQHETISTHTHTPS